MSADRSPSTDVVPRRSAAAPRRLSPTNPFVRFLPSEIEQSVPDRFEQQVRRYADRVAVRSTSGELTYEALNVAANRVAHAILERRGARSEPVALLLERGVAPLAAILGILKAGKLYAPLEPAHPAERLAYMLEDAQVGLVLADAEHLTLARQVARPSVDVEDVGKLMSHGPVENPTVSISPDTGAYLLYTSGSTGRPKAVLQNHRNLLHSTRAYTNDLHISADDRTILLFPYSMTGSVPNTFAALLNGACLLPFSVRGDGIDTLADWLVQRRVTVFRVAVSVFRHFVDTLAPGRTFPDVRAVQIGGEPVIRQDVDRFRAHFLPGSLLVNGLGATETSTLSHYCLDHETEIEGDLVPVGYPPEGIEVLLLDEGGHEVPAGEVGEITARGRFLAVEYWRQPELTRTAFLPNPNGGEARLYRTGDLGRKGPDGCLVHLGRKDFQVKIRGMRIEIAEIEAALLDLDAIRQTVVAWQDWTGDARLVAYLVAEEGPKPSVERLRSALRARLPAHMVPATFVFLDALPLTANWKIDRHALPPPGRARPILDTAFVAPRTEVERTIARIWSDVLDLDAVGIHDDFLALGGDSLLATRLVARVRDTFKVAPSLRALLQANTVAQMAEAIVQRRAEELQAVEVEHLLNHVEALTDDEAAGRLLEEPD
jgi:amino acid adenylation domain-containing protein